MVSGSVQNLGREIGEAKMTDGTAEDRIRMTVAEARALAKATICGAEYDEDEARILTDHVLDAALRGYEYSGLSKLLNVVDGPQFRQPRPPITVLREIGQRPCSTVTTIRAWSRPTVPPR
jgi:hypothetical protein